MLKDTNGKEFSDVLAIYEELFPSNERQPVDVFEKRIMTGQTELLIVTEEKQALGFAVLWNFTYSNFALLDYFAVNRKRQGAGIGTILMQEVKKQVTGWGKDLIIEIERPGEGDNLLMREKRLRFYLQSGARILNNVPYLLPTLDGTVPTAMLLMAIQQIPQKFYSGNEIKAVIQTIYARAYKKESDSEELQSFIHLVPEKVELTATWK